MALGIKEFSEVFASKNKTRCELFLKLNYKIYVK